MPIEVISILKPKNSGSFPTHEDVDCKGGFQVRSLYAHLSSIPEDNKKPGMMVYVIGENKFYQLDPGGLRGLKQNLTHLT